MKQKLNSLMIIHMIMMVGIIVVNVAVLMIYASRLQTYFGSFSIGVYLISLINILSLVCGIVYLLKGYSKDAAIFYKAFIVLAALYTSSTVLTSLTSGVYYKAVLHVIKVIIMLILVFGKNLGKRNTWILFSAIVLADVAVLLTSLHNPAGIISQASQLLMDGTIGLAIRGKYADKDARGTV